MIDTYYQQLVKAAYLLALGRETFVTWEYSRALLTLSERDHAILLPLVVLGLAQRLPRVRRQFWVRLEWILHVHRALATAANNGPWVLPAAEWFAIVTAAAPVLQPWTQQLPGTWNAARTEFTVTDATAWTTWVLGYRYARHLETQMLARHGPLPWAISETVERVVGPLYRILGADTDSRGHLEPSCVYRLDRMRQRVAWVMGNPAATASLLAAETTQLRRRRASSVVAAAADDRELCGDMEDLDRHWPPCIAGGLAHARAHVHLVNDDRRRMAAWLVQAKPNLPAEALVEYVYGVTTSDGRTHAFQQQVLYEQGRRRRLMEQGQPVRVPTCATLRAASNEGANVAVVCPFATCRSCASSGGMAPTVSFVTPVGYTRAHQTIFL